MTTQYTKHFNVRETSQSEPIPGSTQVPNSAGGFSFKVDDWTRLERFLILGSEGGSYYASEKKLTVENAEAVRRLLQGELGSSKGILAVNRIIDVSKSGRAPKNDPAIFALAMALKFGDGPTRATAQAAVPLVCRTGTHIFELAEMLRAFGGWGQRTRKTFAGWYLSQSLEKLALNIVKYRDRHGWTHRDLLRKSHAVALMPGQEALFRWITPGALDARTVERRGGVVRLGEKYPRVIRTDRYPAVEHELLPKIIEGFEKIQKVKEAHEAAKLIADYGLPRECVPTELLNSKEVWEALLMTGEGMPYTAMIRNLGKMSAIGLLAPMSTASQYVKNKLANADALKRARVHPISILMAQSVYQHGHGLKGELEWPIDQTIVDALDDAFYKAFAMVEPTGKRYLLGLDISGSMDVGGIAGTFLTPRMASAAMAMVIARTEWDYHFVGFTSGAKDEWRPGLQSQYGYRTGLLTLEISARQRLSDVVAYTAGLPLGGTDCALPMIYALKHKIPVDVFVIYTDSETWANPELHPVQALRKYRDAMGIPAKLIVVGMVSNGFSIADPSDAGMLDVIGMDAAAPAVMADFVTGGKRPEKPVDLEQ